MLAVCDGDDARDGDGVPLAVALALRVFEGEAEVEAADAEAVGEALREGDADVEIKDESALTTRMAWFSLSATQKFRFPSVATCTGL